MLWDEVYNFCKLFGIIVCSLEMLSCRIEEDIEDSLVYFYSCGLVFLLVRFIIYLVCESVLLSVEDIEIYVK